MCLVPVIMSYAVLAINTICNWVQERQALPQALYARIKVLLFSFAIVVIDYQLLLLALPYIVQPINTLWNWIEENDLNTKVSPFLCGFCMSFFSCVMIYLGNHERLDGPPFFRRGRNEELWDQYLDYLRAILAGMTITFLMYV